LSEKLFLELEMQLGEVSDDGEVYASCHYDDCDGSPLDFWPLEKFRGWHPETPELPEVDKVYPLYDD
jgi:hypothetical protein